MTIHQHTSFDVEAAGLNATSKTNPAVAKMVAAWENKNAKRAMQGSGLALMAMSLTACGGSSSTTPAATATTATTTTTVVSTAGQTFNLTPLDDIASNTTAVHGAISAEFRFSELNDTVNGITASIQANDTLLDNSTTDTDVLNITATGAMNAMTAVNIETANVNMASGAATAVFTNFTGMTAVNVSGVVAGTVTNAGTALISTADYTRVLTVQADYSGTAAASTSNVQNVAVSGSSFGTTVATQSTLLLDNTDGGTDTLETLNVASNGTAANVFYLNASTDTTFETINITGGAAATVRLDHADVTGITIAAGTNTADVDLSIDKNGATTTATNVLNMSGADSITLRDSTAGGDTANLTGLASGQKVVLSTDFTGATITMAGAARTAQAASVTIELDNSTAATDVDIGGNLDVQDTAAINIISSGNASTATAATVENGFTLVGDAATVTLTGDTHIDADLTIDAAGATGTAARAVVVDASGMTGTAYVELNATASTLVSYTMTGTANNDELIANAAGSSLTGGAGNDTLTGGAGGDTILGGLGIDTVDANAGTNSVTLGAGADTVTFGDLDVAAVAQVNTLTFLAAGIFAAADVINVTIAGLTKTYQVTIADVAGSAGADAALIANELGNFINTSFTGVTASSATIVTTVTATVATDATPAISFTTTGITALDLILATGTTGVDAVAVATTVTDFDSAATGDTINIGVAGINAGIAQVLDNGDSVATSAADAVVILDYVVGTAFSDTDGIADGQNVIKASYSTAVNSAANFSTQLGLNTITVDAAFATGNAITAVFYDADSSQMVLSFLVHDAGDAILDGTTAVNEVGRFDMTQAEYAAIDATDFAFIA